MADKPFCAGSVPSGQVWAAIGDLITKAQELLRNREKELAEAQRLAQVGSWDWDPAADVVNWSEQLYRIAGRNPSSPAVNYKEHGQLYTPESWERLQQAVTEALQTNAPYELDLEMVRPDETTRWVHARGEAERDPAGSITRLRGTVQDITERKHAEDKLRELSGRLIHAHEQERIRLARELHDDAVQRLGLLSINLEMLRQQLNEAPVDIHGRINELSQQVEDLASELRQLSHELHPAKLEYLGLEAAIRAFCEELSDARHITVQVDVKDVPRSLPSDVALCLYRVTQEALQNVTKHSGAGSATVVLAATEKEMLLSVTDSGVGFDVHALQGREGSLGLISMRERVHLAQGQLSVTSEKGQGTRIEVRVPLPSEAGSDVAVERPSLRESGIGRHPSRGATEADGAVMSWNAFPCISADGEIDFESSVRMFEQVADLAVDRRVSKILLDGLLLTGELSDIDRINLAVKTTDYLRQLGIHPAIAVVGNPPTFNGLAVFAAQSVGADVRLFSTIQEAMEWLGGVRGL